MDRYDGGGLNAFNRKKNTFTHYRHKPENINSLQSDTVSAILEDSEGNLWIGNGKVISVYDSKKQNFSHYTLHHPFLANSGGLSIFSLHEDRQKVFWIGTNNGILSFDRRTGKTSHYPYDPDHPAGISDYWALSILEDSKGNLWIGPGSQALNRFNRKTGEFTHYKYDKSKPGSIPSNTVPTIYEDRKGNLWFGTGEGGLGKFNYATETFTTYSVKHGLAGNAIFSILEDDAGNLWLGTDNGLSKFSPTTETFTNYSAADGLQSKLFTNLYTKGAAYKGKDGTLYFGGNNGLNSFNPAAIRTNTYVPPVVITQVSLFDKPLAGINEAKKVELNYDQNFFSLEFAALNYTSTHKNQYAYQLEGVDRAWVQAETRRLASYTDISPGEYVFRVKGSNNDGLWNRKGTDFKIIIHPPWWQSWWAYVLYGFAFIAILFAAGRLQRRLLIQREQEKARERELKQARKIEKAYLELKQTQTQLVQKEKMASLGELTAGIAHEIQNPLNFINNFSEVSKELCHELTEELTAGRESEATAIVEGLTQLLEKIHNHGQRADSIVKGMLQHSRNSTGQKEPINLNPLAYEYLQLAYHGLRAKDSSFNATLTLNLDEQLEEVSVVPQELGRVLLNLYSNAFYAVQLKQKQVTGDYKPEVRLSTRQLQGRVEIRVHDNGIGIPDKVRSKIFQPFFTTKPTGQGTGLGLSLSYDIITKGHGGELIIASEAGKWTEFTITLPCIPVSGQLPDTSVAPLPPANMIY